MSRFDSCRLRLVRAIKATMDLPPEEEGEVVGGFGYDKLAKADSDLYTAFSEVIMQHTFTTDEKVRQLEQRLTEQLILNNSMKAEITRLQGDILRFNGEQDRFMRACVCVTLARQPNPAPELK